MDEIKSHDRRVDLYLQRNGTLLKCSQPIFTRLSFRSLFAFAPSLSLSFFVSKRRLSLSPVSTPPTRRTAAQLSKTLDVWSAR